MSNVKFFICRHCGNQVEMIHDAGVPVICCGEPMEELKANTVDASLEKHVPAVTVEGDTVKVQVGSAEQQQPQQHVPGPGPGHGPDHGAPLVVVLPVPLPPGGVQVSGGQQLRHGAEEQEAACKAKKTRHSGGSGGKRPRRPEGGPR